MHKVSRITILAQVDAVTGYGKVLHETFVNLERLGSYVSIRPVSIWETPGVAIPSELKSRFVHSVQPENLELIIGVPWIKPTPGKEAVHFTMWETTKPKVEWIQNMNLSSAILVPSVWNKESFKTCGVTKPIHIIPLGYNPSEFWPFPMHMDGPCVFGTAGRLAHGRMRKGTEMVIECFRDAFQRNMDVRLAVKIHSDCPRLESTDPRIWVYRENWQTERIRSFLNGITCFVSAAKGEGWGLWQHQSMVVGRPVIGAIYGGMAEFMNNKNSYPVNFIETPSGEDYQGGGNWAELDRDSMIGQMRRVYIDRIEARKKGNQASKDVAHLTWEHSAVMIKAVCRSMALLE